MKRRAAGTPLRPASAPGSLRSTSASKRCKARPRPLIATGEGAEAYKERLEEALAGDVQIPRRAGVLWPADVAALGAELYAQGVRHDPFDLAPEYIRKPEAVRNWERRRLLKS